MKTKAVVPITEIKILLYKYLKNGIQRLLVSSNIVVKLSSVGLLTKNLGGNINNSFNGLNAFTNVYTSGNTINMPKIPMNNITLRFPKKDLDSL